MENLCAPPRYSYKKDDIFIEKCLETIKNILATIKSDYGRPYGSPWFFMVSCR